MNIDLIRPLPLFRGMEDAEIALALKALAARESKYQKGETVLSVGDQSRRMGLVLDGSVTIESSDMWGNRTILSHVGKNGCFAESYALLADTPLLVDVVANERCRILFLRIDSLTLSCAELAAWRAKLTTNLLQISARKNLHLSGRSFHTAPKAVRGRVMAYLNSVALQKRTTVFEIPFDRQQLADYLNVERTALSRELGKMCSDGLIRVKRNHFEIIRSE